MRPPLEEILSERDRRSALRGDWLRKLGDGGISFVLVQLSPVAPAGLRDRPEIGEIFARGERSFESAAEAMGWNPLRLDSERTVLGPWTLFSSPTAGPDGRFEVMDPVSPSGPSERYYRTTILSTP